jgi:2'-5' RNA ligase
MGAARPVVSASTRRFVALPVAPHVVAALDAALVPVRAAVPELRWTEPAGWHITLAFVGDLADERADDLAAAVEEAVAEHAPSPLRVTSAAVLRGTVLVVEVADVDGGAASVELGARVQDAIATRGLPVERRTLRPHVTLARGRRGEVSDRVLSGTELAVAVADARVPLAWAPPAAEVWCSAGRSHGRGYAVEASVPFAG